MVGTVIILLAVAGVLWYFAKRQESKDQEAEAIFRATMLALEEKAKREGTFKVSYFDKEQK